MAVKQSSGTEIEKFLECAVCFHVWDDPRTLSCHHSFCRTCIDDIIKFDESGSAEITCPTCRSSSTLTMLQTTNDLPKPYVVLELLEHLKKERKANLSVDLCEGVKGCITHITQWCLKCKRKLCKDCFTQHVCLNKLSVVGDLHVFSNRFRMTCNQHNALITKICTTCNSQRLCVYCTNRDHKEHETLTLSALSNDIKSQYLEKLTQTKQHFQLNYLSYEEAVEETDEYKQKLILELDTRIIRKVNNYIKNLNNQKQSTIMHYEGKVKEWKEHLEQHGLLQDNFVNTITNAMNEVQAMETFRVIVDEVANTKKIKTLTTLQCLNFTLTKDTPQDIGTLRGNTFQGNSLTNPVMTDKLFEATEIKINKEECEKTIHLIENLTEEFDQLSSRLNFNTYKECDILHLITSNSFEKLQTIYLLEPNQLNNGKFIYSAVEHNKPKILKLLLKVQNIDINFVTKTYIKHSSLHLACEKGHKDIVELLIRNNSRVDEKDNYGRTSLHRASSNGHKKIVELLMHNNARVDEKDNRGRTPLYVASLYGRKDIVELLIRNNARVDEKSNRSRTPLHVASWFGHKEIVELLIRNNARVDEKSNRSWTPLYVASRKGHKDIVELLIRNNARVDEKSNRSWTPLHVASWEGQKEIVELLIRNNARVDVKDNNGWTPLHLASSGGQKEIVELLICYNARVDVKDNDGQTPLYVASSGGHKDIVELLIRNNARVDVKDIDGWTPLYVASLEGHKEIVELLIRNNARVDVEDNYGQTPLHFASSGGHKDIVELLNAFNKNS